MGKLIIYTFTFYKFTIHGGFLREKNNQFYLQLLAIVFFSLFICLFYFTDSWKNLIGTQLEEMETRMTSKMEKSIKSVKFDLKTKINEVKNMLAFMQTTHTSSDDPSSESTGTELNTILPLRSLEEFLQFDILIADCEEKRNGLVSFFFFFSIPNVSFNVRNYC